MKLSDIKILLLIGYMLGYPLAVVPPMFIDHMLTTHFKFPEPRYYPDAQVYCPIIWLAMLVMIASIFRWSRLKLPSLYASVCIFVAAIVASFKLFLPEFPHGNLLSVGATTAFLSAFTIFAWSIGDQVLIDPESIKDAGNSTFEYLKALLSFVRQGAFAGVTLFGVLFLAAFTTEFQYADATVKSDSDKFILHINIAAQIGFYAIYAVVGAVRYFFVMNLQILSSFKSIAIRLDAQMLTSQKPPGELCAPASQAGPTRAPT